jgi:hypothetical protein
MSFEPEVNQLHSLTQEAMNARVNEAKQFFKTLQPVALDLYDNLERWLPCIETYHALELSAEHLHTIQSKINDLTQVLKHDYAFNAIELQVVEAVASWGLPFLEKQGFHDALDHSIKVALSSIALCRYLEVPRFLQAMSVLVSLLHDPKINVKLEDQMAMLVSHPSLASALLTIFLSPEHCVRLGATCILPHLEALSVHYKVPPVELGVSAVSALMENLDSGYVVENGFVRHLTQLHLERGVEKNSLICQATPESMEHALELAEYIRMQYLTQLFSTFNTYDSTCISPIEGIILDASILQNVTKQTYIRSGFEHIAPLPLSDVFTSHMHMKNRHRNCEILGAILGASDNGQLNGYKVLSQSMDDYISTLRRQLNTPASSVLQQWHHVLNEHKLKLPFAVSVEHLCAKGSPQLMINAFGERVWRSIVENYLYLKGNISNLVALHYVVREGVAFLASIQRYSEQVGFGHLCLESRFGDFVTADSWTECLEEIAYDEEFLFLLYREMDHWFEGRMIQWPEELPLNKAHFIEIYKKETVFIEVVLPLIPNSRRLGMAEGTEHKSSHQLVVVRPSSKLSKNQVINKPLGWSARII